MDQEQQKPRQTVTGLVTLVTLVQQSCSLGGRVVRLWFQDGLSKIETSGFDRCPV
jgi:hypothetical protein